MSEYENPQRSGRAPTVEDVRRLMGASTPHFAMQIRNRIENLIVGLPEGDDARRLGEVEIKRLEALAYEGEKRGNQGSEGEAPLPSIKD